MDRRTDWFIHLGGVVLTRNMDRKTDWFIHLGETWIDGQTGSSI